MNIPALPAHVSTVLISGAGGYVGREVAALLLARYPALRLVLTDIRTPEPIGTSESIAADLSSLDDVAKLFEGRQIDAVSRSKRDRKAGADVIQLNALADHRVPRKIGRAHV